MITSPNPVPDTVHVLAIPGSLRAASYNRLILDAATTLDVPGTTMDVFGEVADIPVFNEDLQNQAPDGVHSLWSAVSAADALLFATPEYNQFFTGLDQEPDRLALPGSRGRRRHRQTRCRHRRHHRAMGDPNRPDPTTPRTARTWRFCAARPHPVHSPCRHVVHSQRSDRPRHS